MKSLRLTFFVRGILIPILFTVAVIAAISITEPVIESRSQTVYSGSGSKQGSYEKTQYELFKELDADSPIGYITSEDFELSANVLYKTTKANSTSLSKASTEPWNGGCVVVFGNNTKSQFKALHSAGIGDTVKFEFYNHDKYAYRINRIKHNMTESDIKELNEENTLVMCLSYNDFSDLGNSYFYTVYVAETV